MSLTQALNTGLLGLQTSQKGLDLVSRNIANVNTVGYTKKIFHQESLVLNGTGAGVQVTDVTRRVDMGLIKQLNRETATLESLEVKAEYFERMQALFGKPGANNTIAHLVGTLADEVESLALDPNETGQHLSTVRSAEDVAMKLNAMADTLQSLRLEADQEIEDAVGQVNDLLYEIKGLNEEIGYALATEKDGTDLIDKRDQAVKELSALMNVTTFERGTGELTVYTEGGSILVDFEVKELSHASLSNIVALHSKDGGDIGPISLNGQDITDDITKGRLSALIEMRDSTLTDYQAQLDELSGSLRDTVNRINNQGTSFPNLASEYVGTRTFLDSTAQTITLDGNHDVVMALFDSDGAQLAAINFKDTANPALTAGTPILGAAQKVLDNAAHNENSVAGAMEAWLNHPSGGNLASATVSFNSDGQMEIDLGTDTVSLAFKDVNTSADPLDPATWTHEDAEIAFDMDADGTDDTTVSGFSNFFGLNDVYTADRKDWAWESDIKSTGWTPMTGGDLVFSDNDPANAGLGWGTIPVAATDTIQDIADKINTDPAISAFVEAEVVPEGDGVRLRLKQLKGYDMAVTQDSGTALITALGLEVSNTGLSNDLAIKKEITENPSLISRGAMIYNTDTSEYELSPGDNTTANALAEALRATRGFESAGDLPATTKSLADYAAMTVSSNASEAASNESKLEYQLGLVDTLSLKNAEISGVNLDEELAELLIFEQSYAASARVISTISDMFDILNSIV